MSSEYSSNHIDMRRVPMAIAAVALLGVPFAFIQNSMGLLDKNPSFVLGLGVVALASAGGLAYFLVFRHLPAQTRRNPYLIFFAIFAFAAVLDFLIAMTLLGFTDVMAKYFESGEPYLKSSHGMAVNLWDGTVHFSLYLWMSFCLAAGVVHRRAALFWAGSMLVSCLVYMTGNLIGEYAEHIEPSYLLNLPFMIVPLFYAWRVAASTTSDAPSGARAGVVDYALAVALFGVAAFCAFRMLVVLNPQISLTAHWAQEVEPYLLSPSRYPQIQMLVYGFYLMPFTLLAALSLFRAPSVGMLIWSWFLAGAVAQGQFAHLLASSHAAPDALSVTVWLSNIALAAVPLWYAWRYDARLNASV